LPNFVKLFWRLFRDSSIPVYKKALPVIAGLICLAYVLFPVDLLPDPYVFIGQLDDATVILFIMAPAIWLFVRLCPKELVKKYAHQINDGAA